MNYYMIKDTRTIHTGNTLLYDQRIEPAKYITVYVIQKKHFFKILEILKRSLQNF